MNPRSLWDGVAGFATGCSALQINITLVLPPVRPLAAHPSCSTLPSGGYGVPSLCKINRTKL